MQNAKLVEAGEDPAGLEGGKTPTASQGFVTEASPWQGWFGDWAAAAE